MLVHGDFLKAIIALCPKLKFQYLHNVTVVKANGSCVMYDGNGGFSLDVLQEFLENMDV
jgi:hypothetical protein